jgi:hypothetical protein
VAVVGLLPGLTVSTGIRNWLVRAIDKIAGLDPWHVLAVDDDGRKRPHGGLPEVVPEGVRANRCRGG